VNQLNERGTRLQSDIDEMMAWIRDIMKQAGEISAETFEE